MNDNNDELKKDNMKYLIAGQVELGQSNFQLGNKPTKEKVQKSKVKGVKLEDEDTENQTKTGEDQKEEPFITLKVGEQRQIIFPLDQIKPSETVLSLKMKYFQPEIDRKLIIRFISMGRVLSDGQIICQYKWTMGQVVQVYISEPLPVDDEQVQQPQPVQQAIQVGQPLPRNDQVDDIERDSAQIIQQRQILEINLQEEIPQVEHQGSYFELVVGIFVGFVFAVLALLGMCICPCSIRAKQGVMIGFVVRIIVIQIQLMQAGSPQQPAPQT